VKASAVAVQREASGDAHLVAYVVPESAPLDPARLRAALGTSLPKFMVPSAFVELAELPVTANGKLDRRALPAPRPHATSVAAAIASQPDTAEARVLRAFADVLGFEAVGADDNFFDVGGTSLGAIRLASRVRELVGVAVSVPTIFQHPSARALARHLAAADAGAIPASRLPSRSQPSAHDDREPIAIIAVAGRFPGSPDVDALWSALCDGREGITRFTREQIDPSVPTEMLDDPDYVAARGVIDGADEFDAAFFGMSPREAELMDPQQRVFLELCWACLERGGYPPSAVGMPVGVFAGMYNASYFQNHVLAHPELVESFGAFQVMLANEKDYIATRVSHRLDLTGPSVSIHTACSTSLVAISQAFASLRARQCDMALAGGVSITCPPNSGYLYQEGSMLSRDGRTRTFDAAAAGTVFSDGAAVVLLKRLSDALRDGDNIIALIRGVAVNNDGGAKSSFTAPSVDGQAAVIATALVDARVRADEISYVETHGTATPIGDPIEIEALTKAFRRDTEATGFCAVGSVKSNIGHTVIAAGATGVIKTALALQNEIIPPSINFAAPNPKLELEKTPFYVASSALPWKRGDRPRLAGVSAFGVGGTNAHVVLQEAPVPASRAAVAGPHLLVLSAKDEAGLARARARLANHLAAHPDVDLADAAHTLRVGRVAFPVRTCVVADSVDDAVAALRDDARARASRAAHKDAFGIAMLFPGQGAQYVGMGSQLYASEPEFRRAIDQCAEACADLLNPGLRSVLFEAPADLLAQTSYTQPATFALEYALARWWLSRGIVPRAFVGHSVGEFVGAVLAGVMSLEDAMRLVTRRGALMQAQPRGSMLSVRAAADAVRHVLSDDVCIAAENSPLATVLAGPAEPIARAAERLQQDGIVSRPLQTSHAFHSSMMDAVVPEFLAHVQKVRLAEPQAPIASTLTGEWLGAAEATDPNYWARHLRGTVRFSSALRTLLASNPDLLLEVGPRATLTTLARQHFAKNEPAPTCVATLADDPSRERAAVLAAQGQLWAGGEPVALERLAAPSLRRIPLPTYPFDRRRHWLSARPAANRTVTDIPVESPMSTSAPTQSAPARADRIPGFVARLRTVFEDVSGIDMAGASPTAAFVELGLDSLSLTQIALQVQKAFGTKVTFRQLMESAPTLDALARFLDAALPADPAAAAPAPAAAPVAALAAAAPAPAAAAFASPMPVQMPAAAPLVGGTFVEQLIQQQMQVMAQQLALLGGAAQRPVAMPVAPAAVAPPAPAAVAPAPAAPTPAAPAPATSAEAAPAATPDEAGAHGMIKYDVNKAFGAIARIHTKSSTDITDRQRARLDAFMRRYIARTRASKEYTQNHRARLADPRVVNGFRPMLKEITYQIVIERSGGAYVYDLDGNRYVDALNGFGMNMFGWQPGFVVDAVKKQMDLGYEIGPQHPLAGVVAEKVCALTGFDRAGLCNTGSEAVMGAVRIARTVTGRSKIALFTGSYHGIFDEVIVRATRNLKAYPAAPGIMPNTAENVLVLDYGTPESLKILREHADELAAVLIEPVQSRRPDFQPREFLNDVRKLTRDSGTLYIFDEVVTGFRCHPGGAQAYFGIDADLASYGKVVGGGFPIGVIAGKREYMDALDGGWWQFGDDSVPTVGVTYFAGTFVRHPLALAAANAVLDHLGEKGPELQSGLNERTAAMVAEINAFLTDVGAPIVVKNFASVWKTFFTEDHPLQDLLFGMMRSRGIHILDNFPCFMTTAHSAEDIAAIVTAFKESVLELQEAEFIPRRKPSAAVLMDATRPPVPGARLGRDTDGRPAWFIPNPDAPGKFLKVS
jgi:acyl transferase domain-containing protein